MPPSPKTQKRSGAPKAKGAVRAKSGCYTCRIRRKKCDEQANGDGNCQTCVRLKLQCLGFGAKRPEWLRESRNVVELREKIKGFLASQGMIKGHSGSASRIAEESSTLRLADDGSSSSGSSPSPTLMIDEVRPTHGLTTSCVRDIPWQSDPYPGLPSQGQELSPDSPFAQSVDDGLAPEVLLSSYPNTLPPIASSPSHSLVSSPSPWPHQTSLSSQQSPALMCSFSPSYQFCYPEDDNDLSLSSVPSVNTTPYSPLDLVQYYINNVLKLQYLLADLPLFARFMLHSANNSPVANKALSLLSSVHLKAQHRNQGDRDEIDSRYQELYPLVTRPACATADDAMAALHVISTWLFLGGGGDWHLWLQVACVFVGSILRDPRLFGPADILATCNDGMRYIIKTTMWFDVLASVSLFRTPYFLQEYRQLFEPPSAHIDNLPVVPPPELSMRSIMGCDNHVVWALAEVTELLVWKESQQLQGRLSVPKLVERGLRIEKYIICPAGPPLPPKPNDMYYQRYVTSDVFRASARVYLHSVLSGDHPSCPEIVEGVDDTMRCLRRIPGLGASRSNASRSVVRSVVFSIFICGCLTDDKGKREYFFNCLKMEGVENVGNCSPVGRVMLQVWADRDGRRLEEPVRWRWFLKQSGLLLV